MSHRRFTYTLAVDVTAAVIIAAVLFGVSLIAPDWLVGVMCVGIVPALLIAVVASIAIQPLTDTDRYCSAVDLELDDAESRRRDHKTSLTPPTVASPAAPTAVRAPGSRAERLAGSNPSNKTRRA